MVPSSQRLHKYEINLLLLVLMLMTMTLCVVDVLPNSWETFLASVSGRENQPNFERLGMTSWKKKGRTSGKENKEGNLALKAKEKKFKRPYP